MRTAPHALLVLAMNTIGLASVMAQDRAGSWLKSINAPLEVRRCPGYLDRCLIQVDVAANGSSCTVSLPKEVVFAHRHDPNEPPITLVWVLNPTGAGTYQFQMTSGIDIVGYNGHFEKLGWDDTGVNRSQRFRWRDLNPKSLGFNYTIQVQRIDSGQPVDCPLVDPIIINRD